MRNNFKYLLFLLLLVYVSCTVCGIDQTYDVHPPLEIYFETEAGEIQISPLGDFNSITSALYDEEDNVLDTSFFFIRIEDWKGEWIEDKTTYNRIYNLFLTEQITDNIYKYRIEIEYSGEINRCDNYAIDLISISINDSLFYNGEFESWYTFTLPK